MLGSLVKGMWLGFSIAAPLGPIGILVLKQTLRWGRGAGLASGFGVALADLFYGLLAVGGVRLAAGYGRVIGIVGGVILLGLAWKSWCETPPQDEASAAAGEERKGRWNGIITTFLLTLSNPMTILMFAAMVASAGGSSPALLVTGIFLGSMLWWTILSMTAGGLRRFLSIQSRVPSRLAAVTLAGFGLWAIWNQGLAR